MAHRIDHRELLGLLLSVLLAGCTGAPGVEPSQATPRGRDQEHRQAEEALTRWAAAVQAGGGQQGFVPVGEVTGQIGDWEEAVGENNKMALMAGMVVSTAGLPAGQPGEGAVQWEDGTTRTMPTISAEQALKELRATALSTCPECKPLEVTSAAFSTATFQTSRGPATAPAWEFTVKGTSVTVTRLAVAAANAVAVVPPEWDPNDAPIGISIDSAMASPDGRQLKVSFIGAPDPASQPCGADYSAEAVESPTAVVVIVIARDNPFAGACRSVGAARTATVELANPLGERAVLEVMQGLPVPVHLTP